MVDASTNSRVDLRAVLVYRAGALLYCHGRPDGDPDCRRHAVRLEQVGADRVETVMMVPSSCRTLSLEFGRTKINGSDPSLMAVWAASPMTDGKA